MTNVSIVRCADYDRNRVFAAVRRAVDLVGGIDAYVRPGDRVLIKPNLLKGREPASAVTTHPEIVRAVIRLVHRAGATAVIGDSPGFGDLRQVCEKSGVLDVIREEGAELAEFCDALSVKNNGRFQRFEVARQAIESDVIINLPKLKTHGMMTLTGAVKNLFGCVPGRRKVQWHLNAGVNRDAFARMLVELCSLINPRLTIMDAVVGMDGNGPGSGDPRAIGLVLAGKDPVAMDATSGAIVGVKPESHYVVRAAAEAGRGESRIEAITVLGEPIDSVRISGFRFPPQEHLEWRLSERLRRTLKNALTTKPVIHHGACIACSICQDHCPQSAISQSKGGLAIRYRDCIRCFCCQEFCPQGAITVGKGWALKLFG